jgi:hypothetical protein
MQIKQIAYMLFCPVKPRIQSSGNFKSKLLRREKMNKMLMIIMVLGLALLSPANMQLAISDSPSSENAAMTVSPDSIVVLSDSTSVCIVYFEIADIGRPSPAAASAQAGIIHQLPDVQTLVLLGFAGLLYRRRKE